jgi:hypothetical protein
MEVDEADGNNPHTSLDNPHSHASPDKNNNSHTNIQEVFIPDTQQLPAQEETDNTPYTTESQVALVTNHV